MMKQLDQVKALLNSPHKKTMKFHCLFILFVPLYHSNSSRAFIPNSIKNSSFSTAPFIHNWKNIPKSE